MVHLVETLHASSNTTVKPCKQSIEVNVVIQIENHSSSIVLSIWLVNWLTLAFASTSGLQIWRRHFVLRRGWVTIETREEEFGFSSFVGIKKYS